MMLRKTSIPATFIFLVLMVSMYALKIINDAGFYKLFILKQDYVDFYPWQLVTYIFNDSTGVLYYIFKVLILFWFSSILESEWGTLHFSLFLGIAVLGKSLTAVIINHFIPGIPFEAFLNGYDSLFSPNSLMLCLLTAFGFIYTEQIIYLFFILPVKVKILAIISMVIALINCILLIISNPLFYGVISAVIYLSGFTGLLLYSKRIFGFSLFNFTHFKVSQFLPSINNKISKSNDQILNNSVNKVTATPSALLSDAPICDEIDFDENDSYCQNCDRISRCIERKNSKTI